MSFNYDINTAPVDTKSEKYLITTHTLTAIVNLFVNTFLVAHIYSFNGDTYAYLFNAGLYNLFMYLTIAFVSIPFSKLVDRTNRVTIFRIGIILKASLVLLVIFLGKELSSFLFLAGFLNGLSENLYISSYNVLKQEMVSRKSISNYASNAYILAKAIDIIFPIILGGMIEWTSYSGVACFVLIVCVVQLGLSIGIKSKRPEGSYHNLRAYIKIVKNEPKLKKKMSIIYFICIIYGVGVLTTNLINICIMLEYGSTLSLGIITSILSVATIVTILLVKHFTKSGKRTWLYITSAILPIIAVVIFALNINATTLIILNSTISITSIIYKILFDAHRNSTLKEAGYYNEIAEHHSLVEFLAGSSRALCFALLLGIALLKSILAFKIFMVLAVVVSAGIFLSLMAFEMILKKEGSQKIQKEQKTK